MTTTYPAAIDQFSNPTPSTNQATSRSHSEQHGDLNDAVEALETAVGITGSPNFPGQLRADLASVAAGKGASLVKVQDSAGNFEGDDTEEALAELAQRFGRAPDEFEDVLRKMREGEAVTIVCLGDSITWGQLDTGGQAVTPWPARLQLLLQQYYDNLTITVINSGIAGETVQNMIDRFQTDVRDHNPDLIIFNGGTNDAREVSAVTLANYRGDVERVFALSQPTPVLVWGITPRFKEQRSLNGEGVIHFYRETLRQAAQSRGIPYVDTFKRLHSLYKSRAQAAGALSFDGSHYSEDGYRYLADVIFCDGFANDDLTIKPGQFKDARGQWILTEAADSTWGGTDLQDANALVLTNSAVRLYLFVEDWVECAMVLHTVVNNTAGDTTGAVSVANSSLASGGSTAINLSPNLASGGAFFINDYAVPTVRLRPGINNIELSTTTLARITGFSVLPTLDPQHLATLATADRNRSREFWTSTRYRASTQTFEYLRDGVLVVSNSASEFIEPYFDLVPDVAYESSRWRFRATVFPGTKFYLGQQTDAAGLTGYVYSVHLDGTNAIASVRDHAGTVRVGATVAVAVAAGGTDIVVDIKSTATSWSLWIGGALIFSDAIPLCIGPVFVSASSTKRSYWNPPIKKGPTTSDTGVLVGEQWRTFTGAAPTYKLVDDAAATRTLTYT